ncbi:triose-phosphate isomerase [Aspergillus brunneoviolaceus CBS 621.78]|uniref:Triosephosphate isomerase n=1 Tax=Aspergillus brunneoviolaceus CBS 621.78 TaxID=1450534 RepID=A0ACD1GCK0_9EURO|nr:Triosephosphate isomerase [Aspergillus brunneoviolaceus CBS 621.78]RAH46849.1 Triosephosphate isomerase [Aspergillus brunneoviolaceus CBS 621.78]
MYFTPAQTQEYCRALLDPQNNIVRPSHHHSKLLLALIPDFLTIYPCAEIIKQWEAATASPQQRQDRTFLLGAQDCFWETRGPYTGEVSPSALRALGVSIVELGHAERRDLFGETDEQTGRKAAAVCANGMVPLVCIGEFTAPGPVASQAVGRAVQECAGQVRAVLAAIPADAPVIFAYEPVWAIGQPAPAGVEHIAAVVEGIKAVVMGTCAGGASGGGTAGSRAGEVRILYGGSAGPGLWGAGGLGKAVDGMFLGRFAHEIDGVRNVVREVEETIGLTA